MIKIIKSLYRILIKRLIRKIKYILNKKGNNQKCYICKNTFNHFSKYGQGSKSIPEFRKKLNMVGSDIDNYGCIYCGAGDRERHLFMYFDKINLWETIKKSKILHLAPESHLCSKIFSLNPIEYVKGDINPKNHDTQKIDATKIPYPDNKFDIIICNHVLEHIPEYLTAINEFFRVLKPGGFAILQTPYSRLLNKNFEDKNINTDELRLYFYGEKDHQRIFGEENFFQDLQNAGFILDIIKNKFFLTDEECYYYGVNKMEDLIKVSKTY